MSYYLTSQSLYLGSTIRGIVPQTNINLVKGALEVIFSQQSSDGTFRKGEAITNVGDSNKNRDIGNSYVFFFDLIETILDPISERHPELLMPYIKHIER